MPCVKHSCSGSWIFLKSWQWESIFYLLQGIRPGPQGSLRVTRLSPSTVCSHLPESCGSHFSLLGVEESHQSSIWPRATQTRTQSLVLLFFPLVFTASGYYFLLSLFVSSISTLWFVHCYDTKHPWRGTYNQRGECFIKHQRRRT